MAHSAVVAYGSETGNAEELAVQLSQLTRRLRIWTTIKPLNALTPHQLSSASVVLVVISTTGQGDLPRNAQLFFKKLRSKKLASNCLEKCVFTSFGLGDSSYPQFNWAHRKLGNRIEQLGAQRLIEAGEGDEQHPEGPGDILEIYPKNFPEDVQDFIDLQGYTSIAHTPLDLQYDWEQFDSNPPREHPLGRAPFHGTLFGLLTNHLDIMAVPRRSFFALIYHFASDPDQKERLLEFARPEDPEFLEDYFDYATRPRRSILEVLQEFTSVKIPYQHLLGILPPIKPRQFSIASADLTKHDPTSPDCAVTLLVAIVKYRTVIKRIRWGVCSRYLSALTTTQKLRVSLIAGAMRLSDADLQAPSILIGPGTGVAPLRSVIQGKELLRQRADTPQPPDLADTFLLFGNRNAAADFFFADEMRARARGQGMRLATAFSRDQREKVYIQDRVREHGKAVWELLREGARIYLCGSSGKMPEAVRRALEAVIAAEGGMGVEEAEETLRGMIKAGRFRQETW
ncbi:nadph-dependent fmn fad containing oxidoreductase [Neofusicoccum parvum]|uniref:Nadph-dependent fmn fad containing oxidoreductase n=1 Tax=Neofusicoccum parvum TaxID=310453 RepID=A0ACB5SH64_9PEZI|nr:nadph-dependent fmn fad containing oxidoreductase [Neofusicoccum parvum]